MRHATPPTPSSLGADLTVELHDLPEGRLPAVWDHVKEIIETIAGIMLADPHLRALA